MSINAPAKALTLKDYKSDLHNDWCPGCVAPATLIVTPTGKTPIRDVEVGDIVLGHDSRWHRVAEVMSHWHPSTMRRVTVEHLGSVVLTADHPMYVSRAGHQGLEADWVAAGDVRVGDDVAYALPAEPAVELAMVASVGTRLPVEVPWRPFATPASTSHAIAAVCEGRETVEFE